MPPNPSTSATQVDLSNGSGFGVQSPVVTRAADGFAAGVMRTATTANQAASTLATNLANISSALLNNGDIQTSMNQFFQDVGTLAANPSSAGARETVLSDAETVSGTFQTAATSLNTTMSDAGTALQENVSTANNLLSQLATINQGLQTSPNDPSLLDQQESALSSLSSLLPVNVLTQSNGSVQLSLGGNVLLNQAGAETLSLSGGTATEAPTIKVGDQPMPLGLTDSDGEMGANMATWQAGSQALQGLNTIAAVFTGEVNTAQAEGLTYNGTQGANLFSSSPAPSVAASSTNTGNASLTATLTNPAQMPTDGGPFTLSYSNTAPAPAPGPPPTRRPARQLHGHAHAWANGPVPDRSLLRRHDRDGGQRHARQWRQLHHQPGPGRRRRHERGRHQSGRHRRRRPLCRHAGNDERYDGRHHRHECRDHHHRHRHRDQHAADHRLRRCRHPGSLLRPESAVTFT